MALKQVKVSVAPDIADAFKTACVRQNISMAGAIAGFMADFSKAAVSKDKAREKAKAKDYTTKRKRRAALTAIVSQLEDIKSCEEDYRDNIPDNLQGSAVFEVAEQCISYLDEAIEVLGQF